MDFDEHEPAMSKLKDIEWMFNGRHFDREIIVLCVRWYLRYKLSLRDFVEMMAERGLSLSHATIMRWVDLSIVTSTAAPAGAARAARNVARAIRARREMCIKPRLRTWRNR